MKTTKKLCAVLLAVMLIAAMSVTALAATTGTITIANSAKGETYSFYKVLSATTNTSGGIDYGTVPEALNGVLENTTETVNGVAYNVVKVKAGVEKDALMTALTNWANAQTAADYTAYGVGGAVTTEVASGYYVIISSQGNVATVDSTTPDATIYDKNDTQPKELKKTVNEGNTNVAIGDTVTYEISFMTANYNGSDESAKQIVSYTVNDDAAGGELTDITVTGITVDGAAVAVQQFADGALTLNWVGTDGNSLYKNGAVVVITYTAKVAATASGEIKNSVTVSWKDVDNNEPDEPLTTDATITTYKLTVNKVDGDNNALSGAEFNLKNGDDVVKLVDTTLDGAAVKTYRVATRDDGDTTNIIEAGNAVIDGLDGDIEYSLVETKAPDGYNALTNAIPVSFKNTDSETGAVTYADKTETVVNHAGAELPSTGGIGTTVFTVVGAALMVGAAVLFVAKKRAGIEG